MFSHINFMQIILFSRKWVHQMPDQNSNINKLYRRALMMLGLGKITATSKDDGAAQKTQYQTDMEVKNDTPRMSEFGFSSHLPLGTDVLVAYLGGDRSSAVIIGSNHQGFRHKNLAAGETVIYDQWGKYVKLTEAGIIVEANGKAVTVNNATNVTVNASVSVRLNTPQLLCSGDIIDHCDTQATTLKQLRDTYNLHDHPVPGVESGDSTKTSSAPTEKVV